MVVVGALVIMLLVSLKGNGKGRRFDAVAVLGLVAVGVAVLAAALALYPLGGTRQNIYLGPVVFLAAGVAIYWMADGLAGLTGRGWVAPALGVVAVGAIVFAGVGDIRQDSPYKTQENTKSVLAVLEERVREGDVVYADGETAPSIKFYQGKEGRPADYYYGTTWCRESVEPCLREIADLVVLLPDAPNRIFLVHSGSSEGLEGLGEQVSVERIIVDGYFDISLIANIKEPVEGTARFDYEELESGELVIRSGFDVYLGENRLLYVKDGCVRADTEARFFLALWPVDGDDLPAERKQYGFDNLDFHFDGRGVILDGRCMAAVVLPEYDVARISTGQFVRSVGGFRSLWEGEFVFGGGE